MLSSAKADLMKLKLMLSVGVIQKIIVFTAKEVKSKYIVL